jgi:hypothetical protein
LDWRYGAFVLNKHAHTWQPVHLTSEKLPQRRGSFCFNVRMIEIKKISKEIAMFTIALVLILFILVDFLLESLEKHFSPEDLIDMGIRLDGSLVAERQ